MTAVIRTIEISDSKNFISMKNKIFSDSDFMLLSSDEIITSVPEQEKILQELLDHERSNLYVAEYNAEIVGFLHADGKRIKKKAHCVSIVMAIIEEFRGKGLGAQLMLTFETWAKKLDFKRVELTVDENNHTAIKFYLKMG